MSEETSQKAHYSSVLGADPLLIDDNSSGGGNNAGDEYSALTSASGLTSMSASITDYRYDLLMLAPQTLNNGRRYHAYREGIYIGPNDEAEQDRMGLVHHIYSLLLERKLHLAPLDESPKRVLDLGTGTGLWAIDFADEHENAQVIGNDLSPIQPKWVPPNCQFEIDDFESDWLYKMPFDYIHARELSGCIGNVDKLFRQVFDHTSSGGYFELQAVSAHFLSDDDTAEKAVTAQEWMRQIREGGRKFGKPLDDACQWKQKMEDVGFVDVTETLLKIPLGTWPKDARMKELGKFGFVGELQAIEAYTPALFTRVLGWSEEEMQVLMDKVKKELFDRSLHLYLPVHVVYGRKP
ncbi:UMTA methyltransferase family protein [Aspergillus nomiae NRRL 13137]|uniref:UMTA methyltransferase family protein n=1 Tax=Aspergillus nomiae NRRL (strain ATCC 15546 / NRRL 13137 / CBS 260.88 / M93) TaxID=1509407 RepID=A0A0L1J6X7_ASPN3|nr:UMTA methyltransferase family protein [Aspergillus nomiae NRRL 13137]KNG87492.1 UMTA methyltransferase family protein [Aspergillus nomiae NRRL 13137]